MISTGAAPDPHGLFAKRITTMDSHTAGEPTRLIIDGVGPVPGATMAEKRAWFQDRLDHVRLLLTREPRGHRDMVAAALTEPVTPGAGFGLIYMDARRYPHLCGHATIGAVTTLLNLGMLPGISPLSDHPETVALLVDTPAGPMPVAASMQDRGVAAVSFTAVPSFVLAADVPLDVPGLGRIRMDLVYVGGVFAMIDMDQPGLDLASATLDQIITLGMRIIDQANKQVHVALPERPEVNSVDVAEFFRHSEPHRGSSLVVYGESHLDRSPCGTGTTAKLTLLHHRGWLEPGQDYVNTGPLGTAFAARIQETTSVGSFPAVRVQITGNAWITGRHEFVLDAQDPFPRGFLL